MPCPIGSEEGSCTVTGCRRRCNSTVLRYRRIIAEHERGELNGTAGSLACIYMLQSVRDGGIAIAGTELIRPWKSGFVLGILLAVHCPPKEIQGRFRFRLGCYLFRCCRAKVPLAVRGFGYWANKRRVKVVTQLLSRAYCFGPW